MSHENPTLVPYRVTLHEEKGDKFQILFDCQAEDAGHAEEQAENAYPGCEVINCTPFEGNEKTGCIRLTLDVTFLLNGENLEEMSNRLRRMVERAVGEGLLTGETAAEVEKYSMEVTVAPEPLTEDELADFMLRRIENGSIGVEDIPVRLARYGLMEPAAFVSEMRERMEMAKDDGENGQDRKSYSVS